MTGPSDSEEPSNDLDSALTKQSSEDGSEDPISEVTVPTSQEKTLPQRLRYQQYQESFSGPLPPPQILAKYNEVFPGCAERIVAMAEKQSSHRQDIEKTAVGENFRSEGRGQWMAFILSLVIIGGGFGLIWLDKSIVGVPLIILNIATLAGVFVYSKQQNRKEREAQREPTTQLSLPFGPKRDNESD